jgi:hypothetical protein
MATAVGTPPAGFAALSRAFVAATADLVQSVERRVVGEQRIRTARDNAWEAMCADRARAQARDEMEAVVRAMLATRPRTAAPIEPAQRHRRTTNTRRPLATASAGR